LPHQKPLLIAGPCSAETEHQVLETARLIKNIFPNFIYRAGLWKPRSRAGNFEGVGNKGLKWLQQVQKQYQESVESAGGIYYIAKDFDSFILFYNNLLAYLK
jgi:3-deoxy-D-arabino-heptulosonate 7-phosphate (DAHP) synthase